ncbi:MULTISPECIES: YegP family protein [Pseudoalteromonas]|uniref:YegP family protein n=1 Tax=Pseudoalteromonas TaxID=53246 RepID=UPI000F778F1C|nr:MULTISPECIES: YegP family protein [Pseudoalteromonas]
MTKRFEVFQGTNSQYYFRLKSANHEIILASEGYTTKANCLNGIQSVKLHAPYDSNYNRLNSVNYQYYFTLKASNGQVIGVSETYTTTQARENGIAAVKRDAPTASVIDLTLQSVG